MKTLILEDEIPAYKKLSGLLNAYYKKEMPHDWARSIVDAKAFLENTTYDLILSDIQLLDGKSFEVYEAIDVKTPIIFCSAFDEYLFEAFKTNGIAYILKPYTETDFNNAIDKYKTLFNTGDYNAITPETLETLKSVFKEDDISYKKRFVIKKTKGIQLLNVSDISTIEASGDFCMATDVHGKKHAISQTLSQIFQQLNPKKFFKINRSEIVHIDYIEQIENHFKNRLLISMTGCKEKPMTSSSTTSEFRKWLEQ